LQYGLYVFGHLSKWFVFVLMFKFWSVSCLWNGRPTIGYNGSRLCEVADFYEEFSCGVQIFFNYKTVCGALNRLSRPEKSLHLLFNNPVTSLHIF
jgi:hypothetical protein